MNPLTGTEPNTGIRLPRWVHALLLLGALPLLMPSLLMARVAARRWGRIPVSMFLFDALVLGAVSLRLPRLLPVMLLAIGCSAVLWVLRQNRLGGGIFLGYSNGVAFGFILSGALILVGLFKTFSLGTLGNVLAPDIAREASAGAIAGLAVRAEQPVIIKEGVLWDERALRIQTDQGDSLVDPSRHAGEAVRQVWVPFERGNDLVWAVLPGSTLAAPARVQGWLSKPPGPMSDALLDLLRQRRSGPLHDSFFTVTPEGVGDAPAPVQPARSEGGSGGPVLLVFGLVLAAAAVFKATED